MLSHTGTMAINPSLYANAGYDPRKDFAPIGLIASMPVALIANPTFHTLLYKHTEEHKRSLIYTLFFYSFFSSTVSRVWRKQV